MLLTPPAFARFAGYGGQARSASPASRAMAGKPVRLRPLRGLTRQALIPRIVRAVYGDEVSPAMSRCHVRVYRTISRLARTT